MTGRTRVTPRAGGPSLRLYVWRWYAKTGRSRCPTHAPGQATSRRAVGAVIGMAKALPAKWAGEHTRRRTRRDAGVPALTCDGRQHPWAGFATPRDPLAAPWRTGLQQ